MENVVSFLEITLNQRIRECEEIIDCLIKNKVKESEVNFWHGKVNSYKIVLNLIETLKLKEN